MRSQWLTSQLPTYMHLCMALDSLKDFCISAYLHAPCLISISRTTWLSCLLIVGQLGNYVLQQTLAYDGTVDQSTLRTERQAF